LRSTLLLMASQLALAQALIPRVGLIGISLDPYLKQSLLAGLREQGFPAVTLVDRSGLSEYAQLAPTARELVREDVAVIVAIGAQAPIIVSQVTTKIPIVTIGGDPVALGLAKSYAKPGGNVTGVTTRFGDLYGKHLELLRELRPELKRVAAMLNPDSASEVKSLASIQAHAQRLGLSIYALHVRRPSEFDSAFTAAKEAGSEALLIIPSTTFNSHRERIAALALKHRLPSITGNWDFRNSGVLLVYGPDRSQVFRRGGAYVARVLRGQSPADLPVDQATQFELILNEATANALRLKIPDALRFRASII